MTKKKSAIKTFDLHSHSNLTSIPSIIGENTPIAEENKNFSRSFKSLISTNLTPESQEHMRRNSFDIILNASRYFSILSNTKIIITTRRKTQKTSLLSLEIFKCKYPKYNYELNTFSHRYNVRIISIANKCNYNTHT